MENVMNERVNRVWWLLRLVFGLVPIVAGLDKFLGLLADWEAYLGPLARSLIPMDPGAFMKLAGVVEIAAGILVLSRYSRIGAYVVSAWLVGIALQLVTTGHYLDVAVRDLVMAAGAFSLGQLAEVRERLPGRAAAPSPRAPSSPSPAATTAPSLRG
jgi:uncharacterized membrane protein YphA (DoxX/SURF4 family)